jgi:hypothetical protein
MWEKGAFAAERTTSSAAAAALSDKELRQTCIAAAVSCSNLLAGLRS